MKYLHTMVRIADIEESLHFYCNKLGMIETRRIENEKGRFTLIFLAASDDVEVARALRAPLLELTYNWPAQLSSAEASESKADKPPEELERYSVGRNFGHLAYEVDNIYETCQKLMDAGVTINRPPRDGRMAFIKSPDNISIELLQKGGALEQSEPWLSMENIGEW